MRRDIEIGGRRRHLEVSRVGDGFRVVLDGREWSVDALRIDGQTLSLLVRDGASPTGTEWRDPSAGDHPAEGRTRSHEVTITPEAESGRASVQVRGVPVSVNLDGGRHLKRTQGADFSAGTQRIVAPMPGRIVRVLIGKGEQVRARQTVVVIEAMKMENELRAALDGIVSEVSVQDGQLVEAGTLLAVITS